MVEAIAIYHDDEYLDDLASIPVVRISETHALSEYHGVSFFEEDALRDADIAEERLAVANEDAPVMRRATFVSFLYCDMLLDQGLHSYFQSEHSALADRHPLPKFGHMGMGPHVRHPNAFLRAAVPSFVGARKHIETVFPYVTDHFMKWADGLSIGVPPEKVFWKILKSDWGDVGSAAYREVFRSLLGA